MKKLACLVSLLCAVGATAAENLLQNGDFAVQTIGWANRTKPSQRVETVGSPHGKALRVTITDPKAKDHGQIVQIRQGVKPNAVYRVSALVKAPADAAYVQVKLMKGKKEGRRLSTGTNKSGDWSRLERDIETDADTTGIQVLLRFRMNDGLKNRTIEFAKVALVGVSGGAENDTAPEPPKPPEAVKDVVAAPGADAFVSVEGAGKKDGSSRANAAPGTKEGVRAALARLGPGNVLTIAAGVYRGDWGLELRAGGTKDRPIVVRGETKNGKRPSVTGSWKREKPASGPVFLTLNPGAGHVALENLELNNFRSALVARGPNHGVKVTKVDLSYCRDGYVLDGGMVDGVADSGSRGFEMTDCKILFHTKKGVRTSNGFHHAKFVRCLADGGGRDYANIEPRDVFSVGFQLLGSYRGKGGRKVDHHIEFIDCEANNNYYDPTPKSYWNADGFCTEGATADVTFIRCKATGNTDGGWDVKSVRPRFIDCVGVKNKRNFRVWTKKGEPAVFEGCLSEGAVDFGNRGHAVGFWMLGGGEATFTDCTARDEAHPFSVEAHGKEGEPPVETLVKIRNCRIEPATARPFFRRDGKVTVDTDGSVKAD